jgi:hypothetical protein
MKIINIGAHKTGTMSLTALMKSLGYKCYNAGRWYSNPSWRSIVKSGDIRHVLTLLKSDYDFFADSPYNMNEIYKQLDLPDVKFILTLREPEDWFDSFLKWAKKADYVNGNNNDVVFAYGGKIVEKNRTVIIDRYKKRIEGIYDHFGFDNICRIHVDLPDEGKIKRLEKFLDIEINKPYPHKNKND